jgi:hypothetical protein
VLVRSILHDALDAFARLDIESSVEILTRDKEIDQEYISVFRQLPCNLTPKLYGWRLNKSMRYTWIHAINEPRNFS